MGGTTVTFATQVCRLHSSRHGGPRYEAFFCPSGPCQSARMAGAGSGAFSLVVSHASQTGAGGAAGAASHQHHKSHAGPASRACCESRCAAAHASASECAALQAIVAGAAVFAARPMKRSRFYLNRLRNAKSTPTYPSSSRVTIAAHLRLKSHSTRISCVLVLDTSEM